MSWLHCFWHVYLVFRFVWTLVMQHIYLQILSTVLLVCGCGLSMEALATEQTHDLQKCTYTCTVAVLGGFISTVWVVWFIQFLRNIGRKNISFRNILNFLYFLIMKSLIFAFCLPERNCSLVFNMLLFILPFNQVPVFSYSTWPYWSPQVH